MKLPSTSTTAAVLVLVSGAQARMVRTTCEGLTPTGCDLLTAWFGLADAPRQPRPAHGAPTTPAWPVVQRFASAELGRTHLPATTATVPAAVHANPETTTAAATDDLTEHKDKDKDKDKDSKGDTATVVRPAHTIVEHEDRYLLEVDLPGVPEDASEAGLELEIRHNQDQRGWSKFNRVLHLQAQRKAQAWQRVLFQAEWVLNEDVDEEGAIDASIKDGVLQLALPKKAPEQLRMAIPIGGSKGASTAAQPEHDHPVEDLDKP